MADEIVKKRTRPDRKEAMSVHTEPGDNRKYLEHSMVMLDWPDVNVREPEQSVWVCTLLCALRMI